MILPVLMAVVLVAGCGGKQEKDLETVKVTKGNILATISSVGEVMPRNRLEIKPAVAGRVENIYVNEGDNVTKGEVLALISSTDRAALLDAARAKGQAEVNYWENVYKPSPVTAPLNGFIIVRNVEPGQSVDSATAVLVMADHLIVKAQVDETDLGKIKIGQDTSIVLDAYPNDRIPGKVEHIAYESQTINNVTVYEVDVLPTTVPSFFRSGMSATVNFIMNEKKNILMLPVNAVRKLKGSSVIFVKSKSGTGYDTVQVTTGVADDENIEIVSGAELDEEVVIPTIKMVQDASGGGRGGMRPSIFGGGRR